MRWNFQAALFAALLFIYGLAGTLYATLTPPWQAPDEPAHYNYIRYLASEKAFPELVAACYDQAYLSELTSRRFPPELPVDNVCYEFHQPPLYYLLAVPLFWLTGGSLLALRLFSLLLGAGVVSLAFLIGRAIFPRKSFLAFETMAFVAFVPMHLTMLASVNNDALAEFVLAIILFLLICRLDATNSPSFKDNLWLGSLLGIGLITKATIYIAIPLVGAALWLAETNPSGVRIEIRAPEKLEEPGTQPASRPANWPRLLKTLATVYGLALLLASPWYLRNAALYGGFDVLGLQRHDAIVTGQLRTADYLAEAGRPAYLIDLITTTFRSFWGQFGWMAVPMDSRTYLFLTLLSLLALLGLLAFLLRTFTLQECGMNSALPGPPEGGLDSDLTPTQRRALSLLALAILFTALAYLGYNVTFVQFQGRYLFPSLIPLGLFFTLGLTEAFNRRWAWGLAGLLTLAMAWLLLSSAQTGQFDKWAILLVGTALLLAAGQAWFSGPRWRLSSLWLLAACYAGLAFLALAAPFWFILPYL